MPYLKYALSVLLKQVSSFNLNFLMQAQTTVYRNFTKFYHFTVAVKVRWKNTATQVLFRKQKCFIAEVDTVLWTGSQNQA